MIENPHLAWEKVLCSSHFSCSGIGLPDFGHDLPLIRPARFWPPGSLFAIADVAH